MISTAGGGLVGRMQGRKVKEQKIIGISTRARAGTKVKEYFIAY